MNLVIFVFVCPAIVLFIYLLNLNIVYYCTTLGVSLLICSSYII